MRTFETGATRDNVEGKLSYMRALSPAVLRRYVQYLAKHRKQADGQMRAWDNWKHGIPQDAYMDSLLRHTFDAWRMFMGCPVTEPVDLEELLCAIIFNANGLLFEQLVEAGSRREDPTPAPPPVETTPKPRTCGDCTRPGCCCRTLCPDDAAGRCFISKVPA